MSHAISLEVIKAEPFSEQLHQYERTGKAEARDTEGKDHYHAGLWEVKGYV